LKKICVVTTARSDYGHLKWVIHDINKEPDLELQFVVTGGHLSEEQGNTVKDIYDDGIPITSIIDVKADNTSKLTIVRTMNSISLKFTYVFDELKPDILVVLGDRYELLSICSTAYVIGIPIAHISGGDITEGAIDDGIRNAVTMLASYHFPGTSDSAKNIVRMRNSNNNIFSVGELSLDFFNRMELMPRSDLAENLGLNMGKKWVLLTYHPETKETLSYNMDAVKNIVSVLHNIHDIEIIMTGANLDYGGKEINSFLVNTAKDSVQFKFFSSLGQLRYLSLMKQVSFVIGNSSSGIVETPFLSIPAINVGDRQKGRYLCENIIQSGTSYEDIQKAVSGIKHDANYCDKYYWGDGKSSEKILNILKNV
jgi:UDP-hydrolysing UDP-N-acetyl-D-glucosamine 2-epimerase